MRIFKNYTFAWWQIGLFKIGLLLVGIAIGAYWPEVFAEYILHILIVGIVLSLYIKYVAFCKQ